MMLLCANPNVTAKRLNGETAIQDKIPEILWWKFLREKGTLFLFSIYSLRYFCIFHHFKNDKCMPPWYLGGCFTAFLSINV